MLLSPLLGSSWAVSKVESSAHGPPLLRLILLGRFSDLLLVVSILLIVYDCHFQLFLQSWRDRYWFLWKLWVLLSLGMVLSPLWGNLWPVSTVESSSYIRTPTSKAYPAGKLQWPLTCGFGFGHSPWLPFAVGFAVLKGLLIVVVGTAGSF